MYVCVQESDASGGRGVQMWSGRTDGRTDADAAAAGRTADIFSLCCCVVARVMNDSVCRHRRRRPCYLAGASLADQTDSADAIPHRQLAHRACALQMRRPTPGGKQLADIRHRHVGAPCRNVRV